MKLTTRARYALHCMVTVARLGDDGRPVNLDIVAGHTGLSKRYLEQLAIALKQAQLLRGVSGRGGGYVLAKPPEEIPLVDIVEATIGTISVVGCVAEPEQCAKSGACEIRVIYQLLTRSVRQILGRISLAELADKNQLAEVIEELDLEGDLGSSPALCSQNEQSLLH